MMTKSSSNKNQRKRSLSPEGDNMLLSEVLKRSSSKEDLDKQQEMVAVSSNPEGTLALVRRLHHFWSGNRDPVSSDTVVLVVGAFDLMR